MLNESDDVAALRAQLAEMTTAVEDMRVTNGHLLRTVFDLVRMIIILCKINEAMVNDANR